MYSCFRFYPVILLLLTISHDSYGQQKERDSVLQLAEQYRSFKGKEELHRITTSAQQRLVVKTTADSLYAATLYLYEAESLFYNWDVPVLRKLFDRTVDMCPNTDDGQLLKVETLMSRAYMEAPSGFETVAYQNAKESLAILKSIDTQTTNKTLLQTYGMLMVMSSNFGYNNKMQEYYTEAKRVFDKGSLSKDDVIGFYTDIVMGLYKTDVEEAIIVPYLDKIRNYPNKKEVRNYKNTYASTLNRMTEYYYNAHISGNATALKKGNDLITLLMDNYANDASMNYYIMIGLYYKTQFLLSENKLEEALKVNTQLINLSKKNDRRREFNLAQRMVVLLEMDNLEEARELVFPTLEEFHKDDTELKKDYSNFNTKHFLDYVPIFLDIADAFNKHKKTDPKSKKLVTTFNNISLNQFKKSIDNKLTTQKTKDLFDRIVSNLLLAQVDEKEQQFYASQLLETIENVKNTLEWQEFLQQRSLSQFDFVDDYKFEEDVLTKNLIKARKTGEDSTISVLELKLEQLKIDFKTNYPNLKAYNFSEFKTSDFKKKLKEDEATLRYEKIKDSLYTFVITKDSIDIINLGASSSILELTKSYISDIQNRRDASQKAKQLHTFLLPTRTNGFKHLNIVPDEYLYKLPFETLIDDNGKLLIEQKTILYSPYLSLLHYDSPDADNAVNPSNKLMIFTPSYDSNATTGSEIVLRGNEYRLDGAKKESQLISALFNNTSFSDYAATKENFKKHAPGGHLLHLSMHANLNVDTPELSHLVFTEGNTDNNLYLEELYGMDLKADMAVLSACNTGVGSFEIDKGVVSLHRAFTQAGVPTTVSSLWSAPDDATQKIMVEFYKNLKAGKNKSEALQQAKVNYLNTTQNASLKLPFYWAGFVVNGNNDPVMHTEDFFQSNVLWLVLAVIVLMVVIGIVYRRRKAT